MLTSFADKLSKMLTNHSEEQDACAYAIEIFLYSILSTLGLLFVGFLAGYLDATALIILIFYLCQSVGGGYHANSHCKCFITMLIGLTTGLMVLRSNFPMSIYFLLHLCSLLLLLRYPLILHQNKSHLSSQHRHFTIVSVTTTITIAITSYVLKWIGIDQLYKACCIALVLSAVSRLYASKASNS